MPGILPMKVIKVGTSAQSRIAQACDRCRSKKIRCDGFRPCCTQCATVGFECRTSDKLSRRAFPRGYTESLEERVRALETEVKELKDLLDEKDEKIDMLSRVHSQSQHRPISPRTSMSDGESGRLKSLVNKQADKDDVFKVQQPPSLVEGEDADSHFMGTSSGRAFVDAFKRKLQESGKPCSDFNTDAFFPPGQKDSHSTQPLDSNDITWRAPPRLLSDQMVNIFFQEWAPLFPVIHRPAFLSTYEQYVSNANACQDKKSLAQLNLVFGIATLSNEARVSYSAELCERQWVAALDSFIMDSSLVNLQCLILAQIYFIQKGDYSKLLHYKGLAVGVAHKLGLHLSQKRFVLGTLTSEIRKKVFWSLFAIDCFSAAFLGLPKMLDSSDIHCEFPADADDEYVTEKGFLPSLPGEFTKISSALALFRGTLILSKVLDTNYSSAPSHEISLSNLSALEEELDDWSNSLATHLKLSFEQDKPSTNIISSRSPLISLTYHYIRSLIWRPAVCANLRDKSSSAIIALATSSKRLIQIVQLLDERKLGFSHCINRNETLVLAGFGLLFQTLDVEKTGKLMQNSQRTICSVIEMLDRRSVLGASDFRRIGCAMISVGRAVSSDPLQPGSRQASSVPSSSSKASPVIVSRHSSTGTIDSRRSSKSNENRPNTVPTSISPQLSEKGLRPLAPSPTTYIPSSAATPTSQDSSLSPRKKPKAKPKIKESPYSNTNSPSAAASSNTNLDYFEFPNEGMAPRPTSRDDTFLESSVWDKLLSTLNENQLGTPSESQWNNSSESLFAAVHPLASPSGASKHDDGSNWSSGGWLTVDFLDQHGGHGGVPHVAGSVLSFSDESLTSGEEFSSVDMGSASASALDGGVSVARAGSGHKSIVIPHFDTDEYASPSALREELDGVVAEVV